MWIKAVDGGVYNLDFAYLIKVRHTDTTPRLREVYGVFTVEAAMKYKAGAQAQTVSFLTTDDEEKAQQVLEQIVAKLGTL